MIGSAVERDGFPFIIDDKQQRRNTLDINRLIMTINNGKSDIKMTKDSNIKPISRWKTIGLFNGEEPLIDNFATDGVHTRTISIHLESEIMPTTMSNQIWSKVVDKQCGYAGQLWVNCLKSVDWEQLAEDTQTIFQQLSETFPKHHEEHLKAVAVILITEQLVSQYIFQIPSKAEEIAVDIVNLLETKQQLANSETEWEHLISWISAENTHFKRPNITPLSPCYGEYKEDYLFISKDAVSEEFKRWGNCNLHKLLADLSQQNLIMVYPDKSQKTPRKLWNATINGTRNVKSIKIDLKLLNT